MVPLFISAEQSSTVVTKMGLRFFISKNAYLSKILPISAPSSWDTYPPLALIIAVYTKLKNR